LLINIITTCFGHLYAHHQENRLRSTTYGCLSCCSCCDAGESGGELCSLCGECCLTLLINNKSPFAASSWSHTYLLINDERSLEHKVHKQNLVPGVRNKV